MEKLSDKRRTYTFYIDDVVLDRFGPTIGVYGIAVYTLLARHAKEKQCFPSYKHIMKQLGISRMTVWRTIDALIKAGLIEKAQRESTNGDLTSNLYTLLDLSQYHTHIETPIETTEGSTPEILPSTSQILPSITEVLPSITEVPEGISFKGSQSKDPDPPIIPPGGKSARPQKSRTALRPEYTPGFLSFWMRYPPERRASKPTCSHVWHAAALEERSAEIAEKIERLKVTSWRECQPTYIPMTLTWLRQGRYDDELMEMPRAIMRGLGTREQRTAQASLRLIEEMQHGQL